MKRRNFIRSASLFTAALSFAPGVVKASKSEYNQQGVPAGQSEFPKLPYSYDALEPYIDARTMELHYDKHHRAYHTNFLNAVKGTAAENQNIENIFASMSKYPDPVRNNGGGFWNHTFFWNNLAKETGEPSKDLMSAINKEFGSFDKFKETFSNAAKTRFGSGWAWLFVNSDRNLAIGNTPNQDNPLMDNAQIKGKPLLTLDVWEHAYYLKYQNRRPEYVDAFWNIVNWNEVNKRYESAKS